VPELAGVDVGTRIRELVEQQRPALAELVHAAVDRELRTLVDGELQALLVAPNGNGNGPRRRRPASDAAPSQLRDQALHS
jgi:hypothetical protein